MKKLLRIFSLMFIMVLILPITLMAQSELPDLPVTFDVGTYVSTFFMFAATVVFLTGLVNKYLKIVGWYKQLVSFFVALAVGFIAFFMNLGIFAGIPWYYVILISTAGGLGANGIFDWPLIQTILKAIKILPVSKPK